VLIASAGIISSNLFIAHPLFLQNPNVKQVNQVTEWSMRRKANGSAIDIWNQRIDEYQTRMSISQCALRLMSRSQKMKASRIEALLDPRAQKASGDVSTN